MSHAAMIAKAKAAAKGDPAMLRRIADELEEQARGRGIFVRLEAAFVVRSLRLAAADTAERVVPTREGRGNSLNTTAGGRA